MPHEKIIELLAQNNVDLKNEDVCLAFKDGGAIVSFEDGTIDMNVQFLDRVINIEQSIDSILEK